MPRVTKQDLLDQIEKLEKRNERLTADKDEYFIRMQNAELEAERLKKQPPEVEQLAFERDELLREVDGLRAELKTTKDKLKEAKTTATKHKRELDDLKRHYSVARNTIDMQKQLLASKEKELEALKKSRRSELLNQPIPENPKRGRPVAITPEQRQSVRSLRECGGSVRAIARAVGVSVGSVQRILNTDKS